MTAPLSHQIAVAAAAMVVEDGLDYAQARRRAALELGGPRLRTHELPRNEQIEDEVRAHIAIYHADTQPGELRGLRELALRWMQRLATHRPHLGGAVWRGTATRRSAVLIDLYCDDPKSAEIDLINQGIDYDSGGDTEADGRGVLVLTVADRSPAFDDPVTIHLLLHDLDDLRGALRPDAQGRSWRGPLAAVQRSLAEPAP
jgi:hypothetical protein